MLQKMLRNKAFDTTLEPTKPEDAKNPEETNLKLGTTSVGGLKSEVDCQPCGDKSPVTLRGKKDLQQS